MNWTPCTKPPEAGNIIRWIEPVWAAPTQKRGKRDLIGEQTVTARVRVMSAVAELEVIAVDIITAPDDFVSTLKAGDTIKRKETSLVQGDCHLQV